MGYLGIGGVVRRGRVLREWLVGGVGRFWGNG